jgi:hypothetical protein
VTLDVGTIASDEIDFKAGDVVFGNMTKLSHAQSKWFIDSVNVRTKKVEIVGCLMFVQKKKYAILLKSKICGSLCQSFFSQLRLLFHMLVWLFNLGLILLSNVMVVMVVAAICRPTIVSLHKCRCR